MNVFRPIEMNGLDPHDEEHATRRHAGQSAAQSVQARLETRDQRVAGIARANHVREASR